LDRAAPAVPAPGPTYPTTPSKAPDTGTPSDKTFKNPPTSWQRSGLPAAPAFGNGPALTAPSTDNRTTALPVYRATYLQLIAAPAKAAPVHHDTVMDESAWHAAQD
jgi:hypothetical protein